MLGKLAGDEASLYDLGAEEEERFEWWWQVTQSAYNPPTGPSRTPSPAAPWPLAIDGWMD